MTRSRLWSAAGLVLVFKCFIAVSVYARLYITRPPEKGKSCFCSTTEVIKTSLHFSEQTQ